MEKFVSDLDITTFRYATTPQGMISIAVWPTFDSVYPLPYPLGRPFPGIIIIIMHPEDVRLYRFRGIMREYGGPSRGAYYIKKKRKKKTTSYTHLFILLFIAR